MEGKEQNIVKIVDFGISGLSAGMKSEVTRAGSISYMPPEIIKQTHMHASPAMDVWSMGCILYAMLTGKLPFQAAKEEDLMKKIVEKEVKIPKNLKLNKHSVDLIKKMLNKNPDSRINVNDILNHQWVSNKTFIENNQESDFNEIV